MAAEAPKIGAVVQARMGSSRLPGKVLADINGRPMLVRVVERVRRARSIDSIVVATTMEASDDAVEELCRESGIECFRGSAADVLDRYYRAAEQHGLDVVVRITADCPLIDPDVVDRVVSAYRSGGCDYVSNTLRYTYPDGLDVEVFAYESLERAWRNARSAAEREHVTPYIKLAEDSRVLNVESPIDLSTRNLRWTVDEPRDLEFVRAVYSRLEPEHPEFGLDDVLELLEEDPELGRINAGIVRNEGYYRSLARDEPVPASLDVGPGRAPEIVRRDGAHAWDAEGNRYVDYSAGDVRDSDVAEELREQGKKLQDGFNVLADEFGLADRLECVGDPPRTAVKASGPEPDTLLERLEQECLRRGVLFTGVHNVSAAHTDEDVDHTLRVYAAALRELAGAPATDGGRREREEGSPAIRKSRRASDQPSPQ